MEQDYINKLSEVEQVSVPDSILEVITNKIETKRITDKRNTNIAMVFAFVLLFANAGILSTYSNKSESNGAEISLNPYEFNTSTLVSYE